MMSDEKAKPIETQPMSLTTMHPADQTEHGLQLLEERVRVAKRQTAIVLQLVTPNQIIVMDGGDGKESVYFTGGAGDSILRKGFGMRWGDWTTEIERSGDRTVCTAKAPLLQHNGELYENRMGMRAMGGFVRNEQDLVKGAIENAKHWAVTDLLGLRFLSKADYKELGLDLDKCERRAEFQSREKDPGAAVVTFGKNKGTRLTDLSDGDLAWHGKAARESVDDPSKSKWKKKNTEWLKACLAEHKRRNPPAEKPAEETTSSVAPESGHAGAVAGSSEPQASGATEPPHDSETGEVIEGTICAQPGCDSPATHGVYCGGHLPSRKGQGSLDMREPGEEG